MSLLISYLAQSEKLKQAISGETDEMLDEAAIADFMDHLWIQMNEEDRKKARKAIDQKDDDIRKTKDRVIK